MSKKKTKVKSANRSEAAKKGWETRRNNEYKKKMGELDAQIKASAEKQAASGKRLLSRSAEYREAFAEKRRLLRFKAKHEKRMRKIRIETGVMDIILERKTLAEVIASFPKRDRTQVTKDIIQARLDRAVRIYGDPRIDAWDLAEELGWDITEVYDAWDYEENVA